MSNKSDQIIIFDTTLRDGEQSPGATMSVDEKILIADALDKMGVDVIEAGFAIASKGDFECVKTIAERAQHSAICSLARAIKADIEAAGEAVKPAKHGRIHTFISTSKIHLEHQLNMTEAQVIEAIKDSVGLARNLCADVEWSGMDASRSEHDFLCKAIETAIDAGASTINIPDTVGYAIPGEFGELITMIKNRVPNIDKAVISVHCHNDLGLATANALSAVSAGARQIECTINGLGERAGNTAMEEVVMAIDTRSDILPFSTNIDTTHISRVSKLVSTITGFIVQNNKAIVGANAFAHESGIHQDGMLKNANTYEIMRPESVGLSQSEIVLGKHSGRHALKDKIEELGYELGDNAFQDLFARFKDLADKKKHIYDEDIIALLDSDALQRIETIKVDNLSVVCGSGDNQSAELTLILEGKPQTVKTTGDGPVDATFNAIRKLYPHKAKLELYQVHAVTAGTDAQAEVTVRLKSEDGRLISGNGRDTDTLLASAKAYINALNKLQQI